MGNYDIGDSAGVFLSKNIALPNSPIAVSFNYFSDVDSGASTDEIRLQVNDVVNGGFVTVLAKGSGLLADSGGKWRQATADLTPFAGSVVRLRWLFNTGDALNNTGEGWYVDDIALWALSNGMTVEAYRSLKYDSDYLHTPSSIQWAGDHDTFVFNEEQTGGSFSIKSVTLGSVTPALAVYDYKTGAMLFMDAGTGASNEATITLPNTGSWNTYLVEVWDKEEDTTGNIDVAIDGTGVSIQSTMSVDGAGHAELVSQLINTDTDTDFYKVVAPVDASGNLTIEVTPHDDATAIPRMQIWLNNVSDAPDRVLANNLGPTSATFTGVKPGDTFYISISDNDFSGTGRFDLTADFSMALPATLTAAAAEGFAYFHRDGNCNDAFSFVTFISPEGDVDSEVFAGDTAWSGSYVITATAPAGSAVLPVVAVYDGTTGARLGVANSGGTATAQLTVTLTALTKYVVAVADDNSTDTGDIVITIDAPSAAGVAAIALDGAGNGSSTSGNIGTNDTDFYAVTAPADTNGKLNVRVVPTTGTFDAAFALFDSTGKMLGQAYTAAAGAEDSLNVTGLVPGETYYVSVMSRSHASTGNFSIFVDFDQVVPDVYPGGYDTWMVPNQLGDYSRNFSVSGAGDWDGFLIASDLSTTAATFTATSVSGGGIPVIGLYDADTNARIAYNANLTNAATVSFTADVSFWKRYYVMGTFKNGVAGTIRIASDMVSPGVTTRVIDAAGQGSWDGLIDNAADIDYYRFTAPSAASGRLTVNLVNSMAGLRSALILFDDAGSFLDSDSAAAAGGNATVQYNGVQALKDYVVAVTSHAFEGGTGSFTLNVSFDVYPSVITGTRLDDTVYVRSSAVDPSITQIYVNAPLAGAPTYAIPRAAWPTLTFNTLDGNDSLTVDFSNGNPVPSDGIVYNGGAGADSLAVIGSGAGVGSYKPSGTTPGDGEVIAEGSSIRFSNLEPVSVSGFASFKFTAPNLSADIVIDSPMAKTNRISGTSGGVAFESLSFANVSTLIIDVASNDVASSIDTVTVMSPGMVAAGLQKLGLEAGVGKNYFDLEAGSATLDTRYGIGGVYLSVTTHGTSQLHLPGSQTLASLSIKDSSKAGQLQGGGTVLQVGALSIPKFGTLELYDNDLIVKNGDLSAISGLVKSARNGGAWDGTGVTSWFAKITPYTGLAAILNNTGGGSTVRNPFAGKATALTDVLVKYTWNGDANIDGKIDADDYFLIDSGYITQAKGYYNGDFNYDGIIDADDYFLIDSAYIGQSGILADGTIEEVEAASTILKARASDDADSSESVLAELFGTEPVV